MRKLRYDRIPPAGRISLLVTVLFGCMPFAGDDTAGDFAAQDRLDGDNPILASDCGPGQVLHGLDCMPSSPDMWLERTPGRALPGQGLTAGLHPAMLAIGHPANVPRPEWVSTSAATLDSYKRFASEVVLRPILESEATKLEAELVAWADPAAEQIKQHAALHTALHQSHTDLDARVGAIYQAAGDGAVKLDACLTMFENYRFDVPGITPEVGVTSQQMLGCLQSYSQTLAALMEANEAYAAHHEGHQLLPSWRFEDQAGVIVLAQRMVINGIDAIREDYPNDAASMEQQVFELPFAMVALWETVLEPVLLAQSLFPLARVAVSLSSDNPVFPSVARGTPFELATTLGAVAHMVLSIVQSDSVAAAFDGAFATRYASLTTEDRLRKEHEISQALLSLYAKAVPQALQALRDQNLELQQKLHEWPDDQAWVMALAVESMGAQSLYGGYDEQGQPMGYQAVHDQQLQIAQSKKGPGKLQWVTRASSAGCIGTALISAVVGTPMMSLAALGICAIATASGLTEVVLLTKFAHTAAQIGYMGLDFALYPPLEIEALKKQSKIAFAYAAVDVLFAGFDVTEAHRLLDGAFDMSKLRHTLKSKNVAFFKPLQGMDLSGQFRRLFNRFEWPTLRFSFAMGGWADELDDMGRIHSALRDIPNSEPTEVMNAKLRELWHGDLKPSRDISPIAAWKELATQGGPEFENAVVEILDAYERAFLRWQGDIEHLRQSLVPTQPLEDIVARLRGSRTGNPDDFDDLIGMTSAEPSSPLHRQIKQSGLRQGVLDELAYHGRMIMFLKEWEKLWLRYFVDQIDQIFRWIPSSNSKLSIRAYKLRRSLDDAWLRTPKVQDVIIHVDDSSVWMHLVRERHDFAPNHFDFSELVRNASHSPEGWQVLQQYVRDYADAIYATKLAGQAESVLKANALRMFDTDDILTLPNHARIDVYAELLANDPHIFAAVYIRGDLARRLNAPRSVEEVVETAVATGRLGWQDVHQLSRNYFKVGASLPSDVRDGQSFVLGPVFEALGQYRMLAAQIHEVVRKAIEADAPYEAMPSFRVRLMDLFPEY